ncbi:MAG: hypothetical protein KIH09_16055 [Candidatus Freyarchaeota archaeon]|nr:hypothetical protein [Candidatus Jordarchaeia archaeon]
MSNVNSVRTWKEMDKLLLEVKEKGFCSSDAPKEIIIISKEPLKYNKVHENDILRKLYDPNKVKEKVTYNLLIENREVEVINDPLLDEKLEVIVKREPSIVPLTFGETYNIINKLQKMLGLNLRWKRPFPRGSC